MTKSNYINNVDNILRNKYYIADQPEAFGGVDPLVNATKNKVKKNEVINWLRSQDTYTLHKPLRYKFPKLRYDVSNIDDVWEIDLIDLRGLKSYNDKYTFLLACIDALSKHAWVVPCKDKSNSTIITALKKVFKQTERRPILIQSDSGKEFVGKETQDFLKGEDIIFRKTRNPDVKAAIVERFNRTLKSKMWRYFTFANTKRYINVLQDFVKSYNNTKHSSIKMTPASVTMNNAHEALKNLRKKYKQIKRKAKYTVGQLVRVSRKRPVFEKSYEPGWTEEIFKIDKVLTHRNPPVYTVSDLNNENIDGFFYEEELNLVNIQQDREYRIERIIRTKGKGKNKQYLIKWDGYPDTFNSWLYARDLVNL